MAKTSYFSDQFRSLFSIIGYLGVVPFYLLLLMNWFESNLYLYDPLWLFRFYSLAILAFMCGSLWTMAFSVKPENETFEFKPAGLVFGAVAIVISGVALMMLKPSVGVFVAALLYLVLWQVELKTNLSRLYPQWYWVLRTKLTMMVAASHILLWMTLPQ